MPSDNQRETSASRTQDKKLRSEPDATLVAQCAQGNPIAWRVLVERYHRLIYTIPYRMGLDPADADDVFQITFSRLAENIERLQAPERVRAWLVTTARRVALNLATRTRHHEDETALATVADPAPLPPDELHRLEEAQLVRIALARLGDRCRALLEQLYYPDEGEEKRTYDEVAETLGVPIGSIGPTRLRCLKKLLVEFRAVAGEEH